MIRTKNKGRTRWRYRYRYILEKHLGRKLEPDEHVHHINGDRTDDRIENLQIVTPAEHNAMHRADRERAVAAKRLYAWSPLHAVCVECGTTEREHVGHGLCGRCYFRERSRRIRGGKPRKYGRTMVEYICEWCAEPFTLPNPGKPRHYCSVSCASKAKANARWANHKAVAAVKAQLRSDKKAQETRDDGRWLRRGRTMHS